MLVQTSCTSKVKASARLTLKLRDLTNSSQPSLLCDSYATGCDWYHGTQHVTGVVEHSTKVSVCWSARSWECLCMTLKFASYRSLCRMQLGLESSVWDRLSNINTTCTVTKTGT